MNFLESVIAMNFSNMSHLVLKTKSSNYSDE